MLYKCGLQVHSNTLFESLPKARMIHVRVLAEWTGKIAGISTVSSAHVPPSVYARENRTHAECSKIRIKDKRPDEVAPKDERHGDEGRDAIDAILDGHDAGGGDDHADLSSQHRFRSKAI